VLDRLDEALSQFVDRPIDQIDPVERAILRVGAFELLEKPEIPYKVVVNEGINLAKEFGA
jgi:N utilization substance protein B